ncbi:MAG: cysteine desulfurase [Planctomycetes bacterium]|nr:cysteine desulfurase [Planctomycetota bacterium]
MIYLDNNATTRVHPDVLAAMLPWFGERFGNPSSLHRLGAEAARGLDEAREAVARALGAAPGEVVFTSGGTEANTLAIRGAVAALRRRGDHVVTTAVEHPSVGEVLRALEQEGLRVTRVSPRPSGEVDPDEVVAAVEDGTILVSVMHVQNETGAVFPVDAIARRVKARAQKVVVHSDGVQALGKVAPPGKAVDLYTVSAHKVHGPKGAGALVVRRPARVVPLVPGGGQEHGLRGGTEAVPLLVGFGVAARLAVEARPALLRDGAARAARMREGIEALGGVINSPPGAVSTTVNASFPGVAAEPLVHALEERGVVASTGSACASKRAERSPTLRAMGLPEERLASAVRFSLSRETTDEDVRQALAALEGALAALAQGAGRRS